MLSSCQEDLVLPQRLWAWGIPNLFQIHPYWEVVRNTSVHFSWKSPLLTGVFMETQPPLCHPLGVRAPPTNAVLTGPPGFPNTLLFKITWFVCISAFWVLWGILLCLLVCLFFDMVLRVPCWSQSYYLARGNLELLILLPACILLNAEVQVRLYLIPDGTQGFLIAKQTCLPRAPAVSLWFFHCAFLTGTSGSLQAGMKRANQGLLPSGTTNPVAFLNMASLRSYCHRAVFCNARAHSVPTSRASSSLALDSVG